MQWELLEGVTPGGPGSQFAVVEARSACPVEDGLLGKTGSGEPVRKLLHRAVPVGLGGKQRSRREPSIRGIRFLLKLCFLLISPFDLKVHPYCLYY